jgi:hypothetical protein
MTESQDKYPGVKPAQAFILPSYQWAVARVDAIDSRIQTFIQFAATVTLGVPALARAVRTGISFDSRWFYGALATFAVIVIVGVVARARGSLVVLSPAILYEKWLGRSEWEFQKDLLFFAGEHFNKNTRLVERKAREFSWMTGLFVLETALLLVWLGTA